MNNQLQLVVDSFLKADGNMLSMEELKEKGCISSLDQFGSNYRLEQMGDYGYRLIKEQLLFTQQRFTETVQTEFIGKQVYFFDTVSSTQRIAKKLTMNQVEEGTMIIAEEQTDGRGRMARKWHSQKGGLWFSFIVKPEIPIATAPQLTLLTAVAVVRTIEDLLPLHPKIKWPNDILLHGKKVCGILTELQATDGNIEAVIIGVGLNVNQQKEAFPEDIRKKATSISLETGMIVDPISLLKGFCFQFEQLYKLFLQHGFQQIKNMWEQSCETIGKEVTATTFKGTVKGEAFGISDEGALLLKEKDGSVLRIFSADIDGS
ncbi:biotin--[acetyl-CoA-carboxylase] ligase [Fervidibacillus halotolerans]|uniref:Bifunctional ligase/repressor BirA n=1 Tax=Fervidibacillus halotolerans TaxID=2980027 RepID=A0A9E8RZB2_9BACI|nr:biotin--[acetyl-CoA-carboxylase] ligase [Fervidibacillus halotolerans]WAA13741.1 biotin--[acetyl-CoA-carboxylase] ligase [Fervidibacillus halotolerans]